MEKLTCTQCGASINPDTLKCEYCGTVFVSNDINTNKGTATKKDNNKIVVEEISDDQLVGMIKNYTTNNLRNNIVGIVFMLVWTIVAFSIGMAAVGMMGVAEHSSFFESVKVVHTVSIAPFLMSGFGLFLAINLIINSLKGSINKEIKLIKDGEYQSAYERLAKREAKKHNVNYVVGLIFIGYYRLMDFDKVKTHFKSLSQAELSLLVKKNSQLVDIAQNLGISALNYNTHNGTNNSGYTYTM